MLMFGGMFRKLRIDEAKDRDATITAWVKGLDGCSLMRDVEEREVVRVGGLVSRIKVRPRDGVAAFEATLQDGTGEIRAVWLGRRSVPGLVLGTRVILEGRLGRDSKGRLQLVNPVYEFEAAPGAH
jgi:RecG-like helicase